MYCGLWTVLLSQLGSCVPLSVVFDMAPSQSSLPAASQSSQESRFSGNQDELQRAAEGEGDDHRREEDASQEVRRHEKRGGALGFQQDGGHVKRP